MLTVLSTPNGIIHLSGVELRSADPRGILIMQKQDGPRVHGTPGGYGNWRCRCEPCRTAFNRAQREARARRIARLRAVQVESATAAA